MHKKYTIFFCAFFCRQNNTFEDEQGRKLVRILDEADAAKQESLESENVPDPLDAEQTWPTEEEMQMGEDGVKVIIIYIDCIY